MRFDNLAPLAPSDRMLGLALMQFVRMIDEGVAVIPPPRGWPVVPLLHVPMHANAYPSSTEKQALDSLWRAGRQYAKGNLTDEEFVEIDRRCNMVLALKSDQD